MNVGFTSTYPQLNERVIHTPYAIINVGNILLLNVSIKVFCNKDDLTYNVGYFPCTDAYLSVKVDT